MEMKSILITIIIPVHVVLHETNEAAQNELEQMCGFARFEDTSVRTILSPNELDRKK